MACSKTTLAFLAVVALMALVAVAVPAGRLSFPLDDDAAERCSESRDCKPDTCGATCAVLGINGVGVCKDDGGVPSCCCVPKPSAAIVAAAVPAGRRSFPLADAAERCSESRDCKPDTCGATCAVLGINGVGVCKVDGGVPSCCCVPKPAAVIGGGAGN